MQHLNLNYFVETYNTLENSYTIKINLELVLEINYITPEYFFQKKRRREKLFK